MNKDKITVLAIKDNEEGEILDTFLLVNADHKKLKELQELLDKRYIDDEFMESWDYGIVYEFINKNFTRLDYNEEIIDY